MSLGLDFLNPWEMRAMYGGQRARSADLAAENATLRQENEELLRDRAIYRASDSLERLDASLIQEAALRAHLRDVVIPALTKAVPEEDWSDTGHLLICSIQHGDPAECSVCHGRVALRTALHSTRELVGDD